MSLTREMLKELGLEDKEAVEKILKEYQEGKNAARTEGAESQKAEIDSLNKQLGELKGSLAEAGKSSDASKATKEALDALQKKFDESETNHKTELAAIQKQNAVQLALKDSGALDPSDLKLNLDNIILQEDGKLSGLNEQIESIKTAKPYLFKSEEPPASPNATPKVVIGGNPAPNPPGNPTLAEKIAANLSKKGD